MVFSFRPLVTYLQIVLCSQIDQSIRRKLSRIPCREMGCTTHSNAGLSFVAGDEEEAEV